MRLRTWRYAFRDAWASVEANRSTALTSVATVTLSLLLLAVFLVGAINLDFMATHLENQVEVTAWLRSDLSDSEIASLSDDVRSFSGVKEIVYVSKEEAFARLQERLGNQKALELVNSDFLRPSFEIKTKQPTLDVAPVAQATAGLPGIEKVDYRSDMVERLFRITTALRVFSLALVLALAIATIFIISNTIRLAVFARRREIGIMKLVGATDAFIRRPFVLEGMLFGLVGAGVAALALTWIYTSLLRFILANMPFIAVVPGEPLLGNVTLVLLGLGAVLGALGSAVSVRRFLRV